jgi:hypothetical protein
MSGFATILADRVEAYIVLRRSLGFSLKKQAAILRSLVRYVELEKLDGPLTRAMALDFVLSWNGTTTGRADRYGVLRHFADYLAIYNPHNSAAPHIERRGTRLADVGLPTCFARLSGARLGADTGGRIAGQHGIALGRGAARGPR